MPAFDLIECPYDHHPCRAGHPTGRYARIRWFFQTVRCYCTCHQTDPGDQRPPGKRPGHNTHLRTITTLAAAAAIPTLIIAKTNDTRTALLAVVFAVGTLATFIALTIFTDRLTNRRP